MSSADRALKRGIIIAGAVIAACGLIGRLVLVFQGEAFMEGRLYALFIAGLIVAILGVAYELLFLPDSGEEVIPESDKGKTVEEEAP